MKLLITYRYKNILSVVHCYEYKALQCHNNQSASLCFISYDVHIHVQGGTDIFVNALSIQASKGFDI
jgi:hypothetical protein